MNFPDPNKLHYFQLTVIPGNFLLKSWFCFCVCWWLGDHNAKTAKKYNKPSNQGKTGCNTVIVL